MGTFKRIILVFTFVQLLFIMVGVPLNLSPYFYLLPIELAIIAVVGSLLTIGFLWIISYQKPK